MNDKEKIREAALKLLEYQDRTSAELCRKLEQKDLDPALVRQVADELEESGLIDDARYARLYCQSKLSCGKGSRWIRKKLKEKGVPGCVIEESLKALQEEDLVEDESILCLRKALALCGLSDRFEVTEDGCFTPLTEMPAEPADYFGRKLDPAEKDRMRIRKEREKAKASLARRLISAGYPSGAVSDAVRKIGEL